MWLLAVLRQLCSSTMLSSYYLGSHQQYMTFYLGPGAEQATMLCQTCCALSGPSLRYLNQATSMSHNYDLQIPAGASLTQAMHACYSLRGTCSRGAGMLTSVRRKQLSRSLKSSMALSQIPSSCAFLAM